MTRSNVTLALLLTCALGAPCFGSGDASAADAKPKAGAKKKAGSSSKTEEEAKPGPDVPALKAQLESGKESEILKGLDAIQQSKDPILVPLVNDLLRRGTTQKASEVALQTAGKLKDESSSEFIAPYVQHRAEAIRREAAHALVKTRGAAAIAALRRALRSADAVVRGTAASGLGGLGAREAVGDLMQALEHRVPEAAGSIGQLCAPEECEKFAEKTGRFGFDILASGFDQILFRPPADVPDDQKIRIVVRIRELGTQEAGKFLKDVLERWPKEWEGKVKQSLEAAVKTLARGGAK